MPPSLNLSPAPLPSLRVQEARYKEELKKFRKQQGKEQKKLLQAGKAELAPKKAPRPPRKAVVSGSGLGAWGLDS